MMGMESQAISSAPAPDYTQLIPKDLWKQKLFPYLISQDRKTRYTHIKKMKRVSKFFYSLCDYEEVHRFVSLYPIVSTLVLNTKSKRPEFDILFFTANHETMLFIFRQAVKYGVRPVVQRALERGANPNALYEVNSRRTTALCQAAEEDNLEGAQVLLDFARTDVNLPEESTDTPLIIAAKKNHPEMVRLLLKHPGIDPDKANRARETARSFALNNFRDRVANILIRDRAQRKEQENACCFFPSQATPSICTIS